MTEEQRDVYLYRRPITSLAKVPVLNKWAFASINHWAVCVGETCYEVARIHGHHPTGKSHDIRVLTKAEWIQYAQQQKLAYQYANYGKCNAKWKDDDIKECADDIWERIFDGTYENFESNCQEFAHLLMRCIVDDLREDTIPRRWQEYNPDGLVPATLMGGGPGITIGTMGAAKGTAVAATTGAGVITMTDLVATWGILTGISAVVAFSSYIYKKHKRHKKSTAVVREWHSAMKTTTRKGWRRVFSRSSWRRMWDEL
ncbi:hypothetical protein QC764_607475 [Podospora pseudoanserina]|uniref:LRAT domain-containing protein n=1 Tax=Podospora pseudoanserina TaxID=2609844 RepID=A0ABR0HUS5_9PEZI|nr:hypothetical protein QC764_607475 [Podospora pseudoanserina]